MFGVRCWAFGVRFRPVHGEFPVPFLNCSGPMNRGSRCVGGRCVGATVRPQGLFCRTDARRMRSAPAPRGTQGRHQPGRDAFHRVPQISSAPTPTRSRLKDHPGAPGSPASRFGSLERAQGKSGTRVERVPTSASARFMESALFLADLLTGHEPGSRRRQLAHLFQSRIQRRLTSAATKVHGKRPVPS